MSVSELTEWAVVMGMWADDEKAAMDTARSKTGSGKGGGAFSAKGNYPHGIGPNKGPYVNTREEAIALGLMDAPAGA